MRFQEPNKNENHEKKWNKYVHNSSICDYAYIIEDLDNMYIPLNS